MIILAVATSGATAARDQTSGLIAFCGCGWKPRGISVVGSDGTGLRRLTRGSDENPVWSPDGTRIAFVRNIKVGIDRDEIVTRPTIFVVNADGSGLRRLSPPGKYDESPSWSPDGKRIVFARSADVSDGLDTDVWVMNRDGASARKLTHHPVLDQYPAWSPDGRRIAFTRGWPEKTQVFVMNADGTGQHRLLRDATQGIRAAWSPDSQRLAFYQLGTDKLFVAHATGAGLRLVARAVNVRDSPPNWSPDSTEVLYEEYRPQASNIAVVDAEGAQRKRLATDAYQPDWSPDGSEIVFTGNGMKVLTVVSGHIRAIVVRNASFPTWQPGRR